MSTPTTPIAERVVQQLFELANTPFDLFDFRVRWQAFGWVYKPSVCDPYGFPVRVSDQLFMRVGSVGNEVLGACLPFLYWDDYDPEFHMERSEYERQRRAYDAAFDAAAEIARRVLPRPLAEWLDADHQAHRAIIWPGTHGLLILQQAAHDVQFGLELDFWLTRCRAEEFRPTTPLIDWLSQLARRQRGNRGHPPLPW